MTALKTKTSLLLACGFALIAFPHAFAAEHMGDKSPDAMFKATDTNHDGKLSREESAAGSKKMFTDLDTNRDGTVTTAEMTAAQPMKGGQSVKGGPAATDLFRTHDKNADGKLTVAENEAACDAMFTKMDKNNDGTLSSDECKEGEMMKSGK